MAHAGIKEDMIGRSSGRVREFCLYGETTGETDEFGLPVRYNWASEYRGKTTVVYGHTPVVTPEWLNNTICIDTGCVFGGKLTALRWPEKELVAVPAAKVYAEPVRPLGATAPNALSLQQADDDLLDLSLVSGKRIVELSGGHPITIDEGSAAAALEVMTRFAVHPKWLIHLPPTMSPPATSAREDLLEHPDEAFAYYRDEGVAQVVVEEKHMGSRALIVVCRDEAVARERFGMTTGETGIFDIDIHPIPANPKRNEPAHEHFDVRYLLKLDDALPLPPNPEGLTLRWMGADEAASLVAGEQGLLRMLAKLRNRPRLTQL